MRTRDAHLPIRRLNNTQHVRGRLAHRHDRTLHFHARPGRDWAQIAHGDGLADVPPVKEARFRETAQRGGGEVVEHRARGAAVERAEPAAQTLGDGELEFRLCRPGLRVQVGG